MLAWIVSDLSHLHHDQLDSAYRVTSMVSGPRFMVLVTWFRPIFESRARITEEMIQIKQITLLSHILGFAMWILNLMGVQGSWHGCSMKGAHQYATQP